MSILDRSIVTFDEMQTVIVSGNEEWVPAVIHEWRAVTGNEMGQGDWLHLYARCMSEERATRWWTTRNAIRSIERGQRPPDPPPPTTNLPPSDLGAIRPGQPIRVTAGPCHPRFYSYWANAWLNPQDGATYVFASKVPQRPTFWRVSSAGRVDELGPLLAFGGETECWYWTADGKVCLPDGPRLVRANPFVGGESEVLFDVSTKWPGTRIWQAHSSADGRVHCATLQDTSNWQKVATVIVVNGEMHRIDANQELDESDIDDTAEWVLIKEGPGPDNRIIHVPSLPRLADAFIKDADGALGHCAMGNGFAVGEADKPDPGRCIRVDFRTWGVRVLFETQNMGHTAVRGNRCLVSHAEARSLAIVDLRTGSYQRLPIDLPEWVPGNYDRQVRANLSPDGSRVCYMHAGAVYLLAL